MIAIARSVGAVIGLLVVYFVAPLGSGSSGSVGVRATVALLILVTVVVAQTVAVTRSDTPALRAVEALSISFTMLLVTAAAIYLAISARNVDAFTEPLEHVDALYLSMMTMTTVGFGDIGALSRGARISVMVQLVVNVAVLGVSVRVVLNRARQGVRRAASGE